MSKTTRNPLSLALSLAILCLSAGQTLAADATRPALHVDTSKLPPLPSFKVSDLDPSVSACTDLHSYVDGKWDAKNPVPSDKTSWGTFEMLQERSEAVQHQIVEAAAKGGSAPGSNEQKTGDLFALGMDETRLNAEGLTPLKPMLAEIDAINSGADVASYLRTNFAKGNQDVFSFGANPDFKNASMMIAFAFQGGLSLPEKTYYLDPQYQDKRDAFVAHIERVLMLAGADADSAKAQAKTILALETRLANASLSRIEQRDPANQYHYVTVAEADAATPNFSWSQFLAAEGLKDIQGFSLSQPKFFAEFDKMLADVPAADWRAYLRYHAIDGAAPYLSDAFANERFAFFGTTMRGQKEQKPRWKRALDSVNGTMGEALGQVYVQQVFPEESKAQMQALVTNLRTALKARLENLPWMSPETKAKALEKWNTFDPKIGYPDKWRDYSALTIDKSKSYFDNMMAAGAFENAYDMAKIGKPADRKEWGITPQTVNAYYNPLKNEIVFPAAILQPPFFDPKADPGINYGGIGAVIGHEIMHGYDDKGSQFDAQGNNKDWWTDADRKSFNERTARLVKQFDDYVAIDDKHVQGKLTLGENIGDLGGINIAYDALQTALAQHPVGKIDGFTQNQRFFLNFATVWRRNFTPDELKLRLNTDPHAPVHFRAIGAPSNMDAFATAFSCKVGDPMVRTGENKVQIW